MRLETRILVEERTVHIGTFRIADESEPSFIESAGHRHRYEHSE